MKLTNKQTMNRKKGMTLLELTVVILVLLTLISILFIGARAWKKGADRAGCILNIRNFQLAVRSYGNMMNLNPGDACTVFTTSVIGSGKYMEIAPTCPGNGTYTGMDGTAIPAVGSVALVCDFADGEPHTPTGTDDW